MTPDSKSVRRWWIKAQGNQLETPVYCRLSEDDCIDISNPGEDRWISTIIQTVDPSSNPVSMTSKWMKVVSGEDHDRLIAERDARIEKLREALQECRDTVDQDFMVTKTEDDEKEYWVSHSMICHIVDDTFEALEGADGKGG